MPAPRTSSRSWCARPASGPPTRPARAPTPARSPATWSTATTTSPTSAIPVSRPRATRTTPAPPTRSPRSCARPTSSWSPRDATGRRAVTSRTTRSTATARTRPWATSAGTQARLPAPTTRTACSSAPRASGRTRSTASTGARSRGQRSSATEVRPSHPPAPPPHEQDGGDGGGNVRVEQGLGWGFVLVVGLGACRSRPAAGGGGRVLDQLACEAADRALVCEPALAGAAGTGGMGGTGGTGATADLVWSGVPCKGARGCVGAPGAAPPECDDTVGNEGDPCPRSPPLDYACSADRTRALVCQDGRFALWRACRGPDGCQVE